jgi:hypothetical protein
MAVPETLNAPGLLKASTVKTDHGPAPSLDALCGGFGAILAVSQFTPFPEAEGASINQYCDPASRSGFVTELITTGGLLAPAGPRTFTRWKLSSTVPGWSDASTAKLISTAFVEPIPSDNANAASVKIKLGPDGITKG